MKKIFKIVAIAVIILILGIVILFCSKINKISIIENIKQKIAKTEEIQTANEVTKIDVTDLEDNGNLEHEHIIKTMYDENKHWEECTICFKKNNESNHKYIDKGWTMGSANNCHKDNVHEFVCSCGYLKSETTGKKTHVWSAVNSDVSYNYYEVCTNCNWDIIRNEHRCINRNNGKEITCTNLGRCLICNYNYTSAQHLVSNSFKKDEKLYCTNCNTYLGVVNDVHLINTNVGKFTWYSSITVPNGARFKRLDHNAYDNNVQLSDSPNINGNVYENIQTVNYNVHSETQSKARSTYVFDLNGIVSYIIVVFPTKAENIPPIISNISNQNGESLNEWGRTKPIIVSGTENYCNAVRVKILDENENIVFEGVGGVSNNNYQVECIPEIECDSNGKSFTVIVTDSLENSTSQAFTIAKVDRIPPTPTSETEILGDWAKSKDFTFTATDYGIGQVSIAFNDIKDLQLAKVDENTYSRDYTFTGDVYQPKQLSVMYKDGLGNTSIQKITIDKIDNTAPTITNAELHNNKIIVTSNDEHETLGEGSGVVKYRYLASEEKLENPTLTNENSIEVLKYEEIKIKDIYKMKYIYAVAEDYVGNVSKVYEFKVPELKLTATANPNTANGKGEIILDWSSYDVTDKYFVIYRKKENQEKWETIVNLDQKLTESTYTDILANDEAKPNIPGITITGDVENNNINIIPIAIDNGSTYTYYIEAYDSTGELLSKSN